MCVEEYDGREVQAPFDLEAERIGQYGKARLDASEYRYAVQLLQLRPGSRARQPAGAEHRAPRIGTLVAQSVCAYTASPCFALPPPWHGT